MAPERLPLSVWPTAQETSRTQRRGRYLPASSAHPAKMLPAIARTAIEAYTKPGDLVVDPMCGIGTTLVEAVHLGRQSLGVEYEDRWADEARRNLAHAASQGAAGEGTVALGDGRDIVSLVERRHRGKVALVLTSPPYWRSLHGRVRAKPGRGVAKTNDRYSSDPANLGHASIDGLADAVRQILAGCTEILRPGGIVVLTARPWRRRGELHDFPGQLQQIADGAGLVAYERNVALLAAVRGDHLVPRASFFQLHHVREARRRGQPLLVIAHEDVLVFRRP